MGCCNGRKNRIKPTGTDARKAQQDKAASRSTSTDSRMDSRGTMTFAVRSNTGKTLSFGSKLEALAEIARNGGVQKF